MTRWITSWFYEESPSEGGVYAQVRGDASSEAFKDVYRRCIAVFFATARRVDPDAHLVLFLNTAWHDGASPTARQAASILDELRVETVVLDYDSSPPPTWTRSWRNQFFVIDVIRRLASMMSESDLCVVLDSDIIWSGSPRTPALWSDLSEKGILTYDVDYPEDHVVNGTSRNELGVLARSLGLSGFPEPIPYSGGEFVALTTERCNAVAREAGRLWLDIQDLHRSCPTLQIEEAHLLSLTYASLGSAHGSASSYVKRLWTQPFKSQNALPEDLDLSLWHLPAEKKYGLARVYRQLVRSGTPVFLAMDVETVRPRIGRQVGLPGNGPTKVVRDATSAVVSRLRQKVLRR